MTPDIYLDIDGVLLANEHYPALHAADFIEYVLTNYPDTTYWLTTHCNGDASKPIKNIGHLFEDKTSIEAIKRHGVTIYFVDRPTFERIAATKNQQGAVSTLQPFFRP